MSVQLHAKRFPPQGGDETSERRPPATGDDRGTGERTPFSRPRRAATARALRFGQAPGRHLPAGQPFVPACQSRLSGYVPRDEPFHVMAEEASLRAAVLNLTMNAIEAAGPGGEVDLGDVESATAR